MTRTISDLLPSLSREPRCAVAKRVLASWRAILKPS
jgi:hypothetical protein